MALVTAGAQHRLMGGRLGGVAAAPGHAAGMHAVAHRAAADGAGGRLRQRCPVVQRPMPTAPSRINAPHTAASNRENSRQESFLARRVKMGAVQPSGVSISSCSRSASSGG